MYKTKLDFLKKVKKPVTMSNIPQTHLSSKLSTFYSAPCEEA